EGVEIPALCDIDESRLARAQDLVQTAGQAKPEGYSRGDTDFLRLCDRDDLDLVINATPWQWHTPIAVAAMKAGKHAATEVPAAQTVEECWELVETSEKTGRHCVVLENDCYYRYVLFVLNMIRAGVLAEVLYAEGGYMHDIRAVKFNTVRNGEPWRLEPSIKRNGNLYPTHPLGPLAWWMDINRGDQFTFMVSMSSKSRCLKEFAVREFGADDPRAKQDYALGDVNTTLIRTERGRNILLYHDTNTPRVKEHLVRVQGTKGVHNLMLDKIYVDGHHDKRHNPDWMSAEDYWNKYDHKLWTEREKEARGSGHGGIDYLQLHRLVKALREGGAPDIDVYDAAAWSVIVPLSEASVANRSRPMDIPDFTRGKWKIRPPVDPDKIV
ncbi:MAG: Gfo/Idh/MocA family oxidoreductase, partial [bacterium]|nr:Gfo/Idh/MocA family oxidoreductase [bacterium]